MFIDVTMAANKRWDGNNNGILCFCVAMWCTTIDDDEQKARVDMKIMVSCHEYFGTHPLHMMHKRINKKASIED